MINKRIITLEGVIDASRYLGEASITEFKERNGFVDEEELDLIKLFQTLKEKKVRITIEIEE